MYHSLRIPLQNPHLREQLIHAEVVTVFFFYYVLEYQCLDTTESEELTI